MKNHRFIALLAATALFGAVARGAEEIVSTEAEGWGATRDTAVQSACVEGVKKINGFLFSTTGTQETSVARSSTTVDGDAHRQTAVLTASEREMQEKVKGAIKGYDIVSCEQEENGEWHAIVTVQVAKYKTPGIDPNSRRKMVIAPFATISAAYSVGDQNVSARATADKFRGKLETFLVQSRRFTILGRQDSDAILAEKNLILRESAEIDEYAKIGAALGTDYLVCGKIADVTVVKGQTQSLFGETSAPKILRARIALDYRILVMPTGQVKWADEVSVDLDADECKALRGDEAAAYDALVDAAARAVCAQALGNIYPVRAARVLDNGEVVLNQGGTLHWEGEMLDAYRLGEVIVDAYNHESLGREESRIALLQVVRVEAKLSYARVIEGEVPAEVVAENRVLCRPTRAVLVETAKPEPSAPSSGVKLPFD